MLDIQLLRDNLDRVAAMLADRHNNLDLSAFSKLDARRRELITQADGLKNERKTGSKDIGRMMREGQDAEPLKARLAQIGDEIKALDQERKQVEEELEDLLAQIPNMLADDVPRGKSEEDNVEVRRHLSPSPFDFKPKDHVDVGSQLGILDFETAAKLTGARFCLLRGQGAALERALINFMIDVHVKQGYFEVLPPFIVNSDSMYGTGQFPKMKEDVFKLEGQDFYLIPTAEVPVTNIHRDEILSEDQLPIFYQAFTPCFRSEAGAHGKDTRGLIRQHQFDKVELVKFCKPEDSEAEHEKLTADAEEILKLLELPYRVITLCSGDISFAAHKCYDIEVWLPGQNAYREISSCSNFSDFQARRAKIRYKDKNTGKNTFVHTLNGSGLAVGRTLIAILENYQEADGRVRIPNALQAYMGGATYIEKQAR